MILDASGIVTNSKNGILLFDLGFIIVQMIAMFLIEFIEKRVIGRTGESAFVVKELHEPVRLPSN